MSTTTRKFGIQYRTEQCAIGSQWELQMKVTEDDTWTAVVIGPREAIQKHYDSIVLASLSN